MCTCHSKLGTESGEDMRSELGQWAANGGTEDQPAGVEGMLPGEMRQHAAWGRTRVCYR